MIRIVKPTAPTVLLTRGGPAAAAFCADHDAAPADYRDGTKTFDFDRTIYAADEVKDALRTAQHKKCAFCESYFAHTGYGDVEHFRPKAGYKQRETDDLRRPGYYWLAYEWTNLFYSCQLCNQRFKGNLFPLRDGRGRARPHTRRLDNEKPLLIDPVAQDPSDYVGFHKEYAYPVKGCAEGRATIDALGLNREELAEVRRKRLQDLEALVTTCDLLRKAIAKTPTPEMSAQLLTLDGLLQDRQKDASEYAAMARAFLR